MKHMQFIIIVITIMLINISAQADTQLKDLIEYIDQIKEWNMSESARGSLGHIASIRLGGAILSFQKDEHSGAYYPTFSGTKCYSPDRDPEEIKLEREQ